MSETCVADFMKAYEAPHLELWNFVVQRYEQGLSTDYEYLRVAGYNRMHLVFKLLSNDLIERHGVFNDEDSSVRALAERITQQTGAQPKLVHSTLQQLSDAGYIKPLANAATTRWYWTQNNRSDAGY
jgi:hypothetical protein